MVSRRRAENLWCRAVEALNEAERAELDFGRPDKRLVLEELLELIEEKKQLCLRRRWKFKNRNGELVFLRDILGKMSVWINRFKEVGDVAMQYDSSHAALPWAGVRLVLQVSVQTKSYIKFRAELTTRRLWSMMFRFMMPPPRASRRFPASSLVMQ